MMTAMLTVENIEAGNRIYNIWNVNEDAEYHESGAEGDQAEIATKRAGQAPNEVRLTDGQIAALQSERAVPARVADDEQGKKSKAA